MFIRTWKKKSTKINKTSHAGNAGSNPAGIINQINTLHINTHKMLQVQILHFLHEMLIMQFLQKMQKMQILQVYAGHANW